MTERTSRETAEMVLTWAQANRKATPGHVIFLARDYVALLDENERLQAAQITTLVACSRCGHGQRARNMVALGDERLCVECAGVELGRLRETVLASSEYIIAIARSEPNYDPEEVVEAFRRYNASLAALHAAADAPDAGEGNTK